MSFQLSDRARELIPKARIMSFAQWAEHYPPEIIQRFQAADDGGRYLGADDFEAIAQHPTPSQHCQLAKRLGEEASELVSQARADVLKQFPGITEPNGKLYPPERAEACWRDFWHFLRCVTYGVASGIVQFTDADGLHYMNLLYQELKVLLPAMVYGLKVLKNTSIEQSEAANIAPYFDHLIGKLKQFEA
ncbi:MAG: phycobilisome protein [Cyanobacteria bacterium P01_G01_bin.54]